MRPTRSNVDEIQSRTVKDLIDSYGTDGTLHVPTGSVYDALTGSQTFTEDTYDVKFALLKNDSLKDIDPREKFIQRNSGLADFKDFDISFYLEDNTIDIAENAFITTPGGRKIVFTNLYTWEIRGKKIAYSAQLVLT